MTGTLNERLKRVAAREACNGRSGALLFKSIHCIVEQRGPEVREALARHMAYWALTDSGAYYLDSVFPVLKRRQIVFLLLWRSPHCDTTPLRVYLQTHLSLVAAT